MLSSRNKVINLNLLRSYFGLEAWQKPESVTWQKKAEQGMNYIPGQCTVYEEGILVTEAVNDP
jgi:hypothetical protein